MEILNHILDQKRWLTIKVPIQDAEDILQDVCVKAIIKKTTLESLPFEDQKKYVNRAIQNRIVDYYRHHKPVSDIQDYDRATYPDVFHKMELKKVKAKLLSNPISSSLYDFATGLSIKELAIKYGSNPNTIIGRNRYARLAIDDRALRDDNKLYYKDRNLHTHDGEVWRDIADFPGYSVSNLGRVRSNARIDAGGRQLQERIMAQYFNQNLKVSLTVDGIPTTVTVLSLVGNEFVKRLGRGNCFKRLNNNPMDCRSSNIVAWKEHNNYEHELIKRSRGMVKELRDLRNSRRRAAVRTKAGDL